jgi:hypothetical protein
MMQDTQNYTTEIDNTIADTSALDNIAGDTAQSAADVAAANARNRGRYGVNLSAQQTTAMNKAQGLGTAVGQAQNFNQTRLGLKERNQNLLKQKIGLGRGILGISQQAGATATGIENAQAVQQAQAAAQQSASLWSAGAQLIGTGIGAYMNS